MKSIVTRCPARICLFKKEINDGLNNCQYATISDTVNFIDEVEVAVSNHFKDNQIVDSPLTNSDSNLILEAIKAFFAYTGIVGYGVHVKVVKNIPWELGGIYSDIAGVIMGLNNYFNNLLSNNDMLLLAKGISPLLPVFFYDGYCHVLEDGSIAKMADKPSENYLIVDSKIKNEAFKEEVKQELLGLKQMLLDHEAKQVYIDNDLGLVNASFDDPHCRFKSLTSLKENGYLKIVKCKSLDFKPSINHRYY